MVDQVAVEKAARSMIEALGCNLNDANLKDTPERIARMLCQELAANVCNEMADILKTFPNEKGFDEIIMLDNIPFTSLCSHHFLPFSGVANLLYIPNQLLIGASKSARLINFFAQKPQLQENLGIEVMNTFESVIKPKGCMLYLRAIHNCMSCRGVKTGMNAGMTTCITRGVFRTSPELEMKGLQLIQMSKQ